jgi:hypothetical protein
MKERIRLLKERFVNASTEAEREAIDNEMNLLAAENQEAFDEAMLSAIRDTTARAHNEVLRQRLSDILPLISVSYVARTYFDRTPEWFYQRLNGNKVNGRRARFTDDELKTLASALNDISARIHKSVAFVG